MGSSGFAKAQLLKMACPVQDPCVIVLRKLSARQEYLLLIVMLRLELRQEQGKDKIWQPTCEGPIQREAIQVPQLDGLVS